MFIFYDLISLLIAVIYLPVYLFKKKFHWGFLLRLGILPGGLNLNCPIWIHAVSVGEVQAARGLIEELKRAFPDKKIVISTVTSTGNKIAKMIARDSDFVTYLPLDFSFIVRSVIDKINPCLFVIAETEIWPNLITYLYRKNIPIITVNGRISDRSFGGYRLIKFILRLILDKVSLFCVQTPTDLERLLSLGVVKSRIEVAGNMKFDQVDYVQAKTAGHSDKYRALLKLFSQEKLWVCGSTHPGEEEIILSVYKNLLKEFQNFKLVIAPRHPERAPQIEKLIIGYGFGSFRLSKLEDDNPSTHRGRLVFILDTIGQLSSFYALADIVFVGGSLIKKGGHNILEPAALGKPVMFGPHMFNFRDIADLFLRSKAALAVNSAQELENKIKYLLNNPDEIKKLNQRAGEILQQHKGATRKCFQALSSYLIK